MSDHISPHQLRRVLANLHDQAYLENDLLAQALAKDSLEGQGGSRGSRLRATLLGLIEDLKPPGSADVTASEWRCYLILQGHYVLRQPWRMIEEKLSLGDRQVRREHSRALAALSMMLHSRLASVGAVGRDLSGAPQPETVQETVERLTPAPSSFRLAEVVQDVVTVVGRIKSLRLAIKWHVIPEDLMVCTDPGILHQLLLHLLRCFVAASQSELISLTASLEGAQVRVVVSSHFALGKASDEALAICGWLGGRLGVDLALTEDHFGGFEASFALSASASRRKVLIIDDELPAIGLFTAYLEGLGYHVVGETRPERALRSAVELRPDAIVLDVMMPAMDGWELLQQLRHTPDLEDVPVIACSVLEEAELAAALGAAGFLKKPVLRRQLVTALEEVCQPASSAPRDSARPSG